MAILAQTLPTFRNVIITSLRNSERISTGHLQLAGIVAAIATGQGQAAFFDYGRTSSDAASAPRNSRDYEREADRIGLDALGRAGYRPESMSAVLKILAEKQSQSSKKLAFLSTHPLGIERQSDLDARLSKLKTLRGLTRTIRPRFSIFKLFADRGLEPPINGPSNFMY